jgi:hypothetical protein
MHWISIKDELPKPYEEVFIFPRPEHSGTVYTGEINPNGVWKYFAEDYYGSNQYICNVEFWMSIPEDPINE